MRHFWTTLIVGAILCGLNYLLLWFGPLLAPNGKLAIAYISYLLLGVLFLAMDISMNSFLSVMTEDTQDLFLDDCYRSVNIVYFNYYKNALRYQEVLMDINK